MQRTQPKLVRTLHKYERSGVMLLPALRQIMLDTGAGWYTRGSAAKLLALADAQGAVAGLLELFFVQTDKTALWETALAIETLGDRAAVRPLVEALYDANLHRRHAAARALGWIPRAGGRAARGLVRALSDRSQLQPVREEAAESLAYLNYQPAIPALISVLDEEDVRMRFWSVFALGGIAQGRRDDRVVEALARMLTDEGVAPGNWWSVGKEALAMLGKLEPNYRVKLDD